MGAIESELVERFVRSSGPGGQNVNKVSTAVELRFDVGKTAALSHAEKIRLERLAGKRMTDEGVFIIRAERFRTQEQNRADARKRLMLIIKDALVVPVVRIKTKPGRGAKERRLKAKSVRSGVKKMRTSRTDFD